MSRTKSQIETRLKTVRSEWERLQSEIAQLETELSSLEDGGEVGEGIVAAALEKANARRNSIKPEGL